MKSTFAKTVGIFVSLFVFGCSVQIGQQADFKVNKCVIVGASYKVSFYEVNGNCGPLTTQVINVPKDGIIKVENNCVEGKSSRTDGCTEYIDLKCTQNSNGKTTNIIEMGKVVWSSDGSYFEGTETLSVSVENYYCSSTYQVKGVKL